MCVAEQTLMPKQITLINQLKTLYLALKFFIFILI